MKQWLPFIKNFINILLDKENPRYIPPKTIKTKDKDSIQFDFSGQKSLDWKGIVLHHTATKDTDANNTISIKKYHTSYRIDYVPVSKEEYDRRKKKGDGKVFEPAWKDLAYHFVIEKIDGKYAIINGRPLDQVGAHAGHKLSNYYNENFLGVAICGNFDIEDPTEIIKYAIKCLRGLCKAFNIEANNVIGHREVYDNLNVPRKKMCPGAKVDMDEVRREL